jgi:hypothetical protein
MRIASVIVDLIHDNVATNADLAHLETRLTAEIARIADLGPCPGREDRSTQGNRGRGAQTRHRHALPLER